MNLKKLNEVAAALKKHNNFLVTSHVNPEGDAIGSQVATALLLKKMGKKYVIVDSDATPKAYTFILEGEKIKTRLEVGDRFDAVVSVDCPSVARTGSIARYFGRAKAVINIDHHISNEKFGTVAWIEPQMSSAGEMLYHLYNKLNIRIDARSARAMYIAILTDTGHFAYESTTSQTHLVVSELLKSGIRPLDVSNRLNETKSINDLRLLCGTLSTLRLHSGGLIVTLYTSAKMLNRLRLKPESTENFVNYGRSINSAKVAAFFLERPDKPGEVHVSLRSKGEIDVNRIARVFKGGGHHNAAGCLIRGTIPQALKRVLREVKRVVK